MAANRAQIRLARVLAIRGDTADLWFLEDGWRVPRAPIMCESASNNSGVHEDHDITDVPEDPSQFPGPDGRYLIAVVGNLHGFPVVLGFLPPQFSEMIFSDKRYIRRFDSDVYLTVDKDGNAEVFHPSGAFVRIGQDPEHEDLTGKDARKLFALRNNLGQKPAVKVAIGIGEAEVCSVRLDETGVTVTGDNILVRGAATVDGDLNVTGDLTCQKTVTGLAGVKTATVSLDTHPHGGVMPGPSITSPPIPTG